ncbi:MAG: SURF1 family protein [Paracoccaceae bacterium]
MGRFLFLIIVGIGGAGILVSLGVWQSQRLAWKTDLIASIEQRIAATPVSLPMDLDPVADKYTPVTLTGQFKEGALRVLASRRQTGAVYRIVRSFVLTDGRTVLVDTGWIPDDAQIPTLVADEIRLIGNLHWPNEIDGFTPEPDVKANIWFARDVPAMADALDSLPILAVLRDAPETDIGVTPWPIDTGDIPNDHLQYVITWFSLAAIWAGMSAFFLLRHNRNPNVTG